MTKVPLVEKRSDASMEVTDVVASLVEPRTTKSLVDVEPDKSDKKLRFSVQALPFQ